MKLSIIEGDESYVATIVKLPELKAVNGLDNLMLATVFGYNCLVGKDSNLDVPYVFFPAECELSPEFLKENNLYRSQLLNKDTTKKGFFEQNGRVRAVKFKWIVSSWFLIPQNSLRHFIKWVVDFDMDIWSTFHSIDGYNVCKKYRSPQTIHRERILARQWIKQPKYDRVIPTQFRLHTSTPQFLRFIDDFKEGDRVVITEKLHWTSAVFSNVLTKRPLSRIDRICKWFGVNISDTEYFPLYSSRTVIKNQDINPNQDGGFYWEDIWGQYAKLLEWKIEKGITLYGEIVGYTPSGAYIQKGYSYGCEYQKSNFYCYRITSTTPDGIVIEFTDSQIRQYCKLREICVVPLLLDILELHTDTRVLSLDYITKFWTNEIETMCPLNGWTVPREWVVIRRDGQETYSAYKLKSQLFLGYETRQLDEAVVDMEEAN